MVRKFAKGGVTTSQRKSMGKNLAKISNQKHSQGKPAMRFAGGGHIKIRGGGAATKGLRSQGLIEGRGRSSSDGISSTDKD